MSVPPNQSQPQRSTTPRLRPFNVSPDTPITSSIAQKYLSQLLRLPENRQFPPELALQILTHKSYRYVHAIRHDRAGLASEPSSTPHNSRLSFLGRRAIASYLALFVHEAIGTSTHLKDLEFLRGRSLEEKLEALRHVGNIGREVGGQWDIGNVLRFDRNNVSQPFPIILQEADEVDWNRIWSCKDQRNGSRVCVRRNLHAIRITSCSSSISHTTIAIFEPSVPGSGIEGEDRVFAVEHGEGV